MGSMMFATATADAATYHYYAGPFATQQQCETGRTERHDPEGGVYTWPCEYLYRSSGPGWYYYYRVVDVWYPCPCNVPNSMPAR